MKNAIELLAVAIILAAFASCEVLSVREREATKRLRAQQGLCEGSFGTWSKCK